MDSARNDDAYCIYTHCVFDWYIFKLKPMYNEHVFKIKQYASMYQSNMFADLCTHFNKTRI